MAEQALEQLDRVASTRRSLVTQRARLRGAPSEGNAMLTPTVILVHGAFADSSCWNEVIARLDEDAAPVISVANPLRSLSGDAGYLDDVLDAVDGPVVLVGHSYGGMVITQARRRDSVTGMVYVGAFAPDQGESATELSMRFPGSALVEAISSYPTADGVEHVIRRDAFVDQFAADVPGPLAAAMSVTQRPVADRALSEALTSAEPAWRILPSWFVYGGEDRIIPAAALQFMAERADPILRRELRGGSHALPVSEPDAIADVILGAAFALRV